MAIAGLHNVSVTNSSLSMESQSPLSKWHANCKKPSTQASSLLKMWRELEVEHSTSNHQPLVGERPSQGSATELNANLSSACSLIDSKEDENESITSPRELQNESYDSRSSSSESIDFSKVQRERVREVFREWQNNGLGNNLPDSHRNNCSKAQWLGEKECERVRIVREWVEKTTQQTGTYYRGREGQDTDTGTQIDRVREGLVVDHFEDRPRRKVRKLCGRQTLLDLLTRAQKERKRELQNLLNCRHVSDFPYRNRLQSLLKGRFLRNKAYNQEGKQSSLAARELGILRQKHTVSGLREGFLSSKLENFVRGPVGCVQSDTLSHSDVHFHRNEQTQANSLHSTVLNEFCCHQMPTSEETDTIISYREDCDSEVSEDLNLEESASLEGENHAVMGSDNGEQLLSTIEFNETSNINREPASGNSWRSSADGSWHQNLGTDGSDQGSCLEAQLSASQSYDPNIPERDAHGGSGDIDQLEGTISEDTSWQNIPFELEDWQDSHTVSDIDWVRLSNHNNEWSEGNEEGIVPNSLASSHQEFQLDSGEHNHYHLQVLHEEWNASNDARDVWSNERFVEEIANVDTSHFSDDDNGQSRASDDARDVWSSDRFVEEIANVDTSHFSDDDNGQSLELRQLVSRRRVSNLLRSDFRASLDQLIQSYAERRDHASVDWELDEASSSPAAVIQEEQEQQIGYLHTGETEAVGRTTLPAVFLSSPQITSSEDTQNQGIHHANQQPANGHQQPGIDLEIINDLRVDMARLHQRMNSMQMMLEACMDMQLELQRSIRQEVSAALNWQSRSADCEDNLVLDESKLEHVKRGVCCICCDAKIDTLLYRCGHMCACSKCAQNLFHGKDKCPMCRAPVIEVIRAYSIV